MRILRYTVILYYNIDYIKHNNNILQYFLSSLGWVWTSARTLDTSLSVSALAIAFEEPSELQ